MKKIFNISILGVAALTVLGTASCSEDFLKENNRTAYTTQYFETEQGITDLATALYANIRWHFGYEWAYGITLYGADEFTNAADLTSECWNTYDNRFNPLDLTTALGAANKNCPPVSGLWDQMYYGISTANTLIASADKITDETVRKTALGEAHFLRGYNYYRLFAQYGAVVLQLEPASGVVRTFTRATAEETLNQVISDFKTAYENLPAKSNRGTGGWNKYTAAHFYAKALLFRQSERCADWASAYPAKTDLDLVVTLCDEVIAAHPLAADYNDLYAKWTGVDCAAESNPEILMSAQHTSTYTGRFGNRTYNYFNPQFSNFSGGYVMRGQYIGGMDFQRCRPTEYAYSVFDNVNDARMWKTFKTVYGYNNYVSPAAMQKKGCPAGAEPELGDAGIMFILNSKNNLGVAEGVSAIDSVFNRGDVKHSFVNPETGKWVPNVIPLYLDGEYVHRNYGVSGNPAQSNFFCGINKTEDGTRTGEKGDAHRDVIMARTGETYLVKAEAQVRLGEYAAAIATVNTLRARGQWKDGEDRSYYTDGSMAFLKEFGGDADNSTAGATLGKCKDANGTKVDNKTAAKWSNTFTNTYYLSTGIAKTTDASNLQISSYQNLPAEDEAILAKLGVSGDKDRMINFIMNERTRELLGEWNRWEELSRCNLLVKRAKKFNPEAAQNVAEKHNLRPIPQKFIDQLQNEDATNLSDEQKAAWQNPGY